jgi:hypothetical protein
MAGPSSRRLDPSPGRVLLGNGAAAGWVASPGETGQRAGLAARGAQELAGDVWLRIVSCGSDLRVEIEFGHIDSPYLGSAPKHLERFGLQGTVWEWPFTWRSQSH